MTTGAWTAGNPNPGPNRFYAEKTWQGNDGRSWSDGKQHRGPPWNDYSMRHTKRQSGPGDGRIYYVRNYNGQLDSSNYSWPATSATYLDLSKWTNNHEIKLLAKLLAAVKGHDFHIGVSLAEVDKIASSTVSTIGKITHGAWELSRGNVAAAFRAWGTSERKARQAIGGGLRTKDVSGRFLEYSYGWSPLVHDIYSSAKAFEAISNGPRGVTFRCGKKFKLPTVYNNPQGLIMQVYESWIRRGYIFEQSEELNALRSMGLYDPASILWERLPWSFVIDWFCPIGSYLELIGQIPFMKGRFCRTTAYKSTFKGWYPDSSFARVTVVPQFTSESYVQERKILSTLSVPLPSVRVAGAVQGRRVWNAIALAHQIFDQMLGVRTSTRRPRQSAKDKSDYSWPYAANFDY